jgi:hypothetical protein
MYVKDLPEDIKKVVILRTKQCRSEEDNLSDEDILEREVDELFVFEDTPERHKIWRSVENGDFAPFYEFHQNNYLTMNATPYFDNISELLCNDKPVTKISELLPPFKEIAETYRKTLGDDPNEDNLALAFPFEETEEGESAWNILYTKGNYSKLMLKQIELITKKLKSHDRKNEHNC